MLNRGVVSLCSFAVMIFSLAIFAMSLWWTLTGRISEGDSVFMLGGWLMAAMVFGARAAEPDYLDPLSIVKGR